MEYVAMSQTEALEKCNEYNYLVGKEYLSSDGNKCVVVSVIALPSDEGYLHKMTEFISINLKGMDKTSEMENLLYEYGKDEFTPVLISRIVSSTSPIIGAPLGYSFLPIQYLANRSGELHLGFGL